MTGDVILATGAVPPARAAVFSNVTGAFSTALVQIPIEAAYGVIALAPLGPRYAGIGMLSGLYSAVVGNAVAALMGSRHLVGGPRTSLTLLIAAQCALLVHVPAFQSAGQPDVALILAFICAGQLLAGLFQMAIGHLRVATLAKYIPYPVSAGLSAGMGILLLTSAFRMLLQMPPGTSWLDTRAVMDHVNPGAVAVALIAATMLLRSVRWMALSPALLALIVGFVLFHTLRLTPAASALGPMMVAPPAPGLDLPLPIAWLRLWHALPVALIASLLIPFSLSLAFLQILDGLVTASAVDNALGSRRDGNRETIAQGWACVACALCGALPSSGSAGRSLILHEAGGRTVASLYLYSIFVLAGLVFARPLLTTIPMSVVAGILAVQGIWMIDGWVRRSPAQLLDRRNGSQALRRLLAENYAIMLVVALANLVLGIPAAVAIGISVAMVLFVRNQSKSIIRSEARGDVRRSLKVRAPDADRRLTEEGRRIVVLNLEGTLFFGTADQLATRVNALASDVNWVVLDMKRIVEIDPTGARILLAIGRGLRAAKRTLVIGDLGSEAGKGGPADPRMLALESMGVARADMPCVFQPDSDRALEWAEDQLLARLGHQSAAEVRLRLGETLLGRDLTPADLTLLDSQFVEQSFAAGEYVFRAGDVGNVLYLTTSGEISILLPGDHRRGRRLVSFAPGVVFGELAVLEGLPRSADAIAESPLTVLALSADKFNRLLLEHPRLASRLLLNLSLYLSSRVRNLSNELATALSR